MSGRWVRLGGDVRRICGEVLMMGKAGWRGLGEEWGWAIVRPSELLLSCPMSLFP